MKLQVNGDMREVSASMTVRGLLDELGFGEKPVVVELNRRALFLREHDTQTLNDGDVLEIVQITAGG